MKKKSMAPATLATNNTQTPNSAIPCQHELCIDQLIEAGIDGMSQTRMHIEYSRMDDLPKIIKQLKRQYGLKIKKGLVTCWTGARVITHGTYYRRYFFPSYDDAEKGLFLLMDLRKQRNKPMPDDEFEWFLDRMQDFPSSNREAD